MKTEKLLRLAELVEANSIWRPASVTQEPETKLTQWRVFEVAAFDKDSLPTVHFVGYAGYEGRVSSAVQTYDPTTRRGITRSGRVYELVGDSGYNGDALYVWSYWVQRNGNPLVHELTKDYE